MPLIQHFSQHRHTVECAVLRLCSKEMHIGLFFFSTEKGNVFSFFQRRKKNTLTGKGLKRYQQAYCSIKYSFKDRHRTKDQLISITFTKQGQEQVPNDGIQKIFFYSINYGQWIAPIKHNNPLIFFSIGNNTNSTPAACSF